MPTIKIEVTKLESGALEFKFDESQKELLKLALGLGGKALLEACLDGAVIRYCTSDCREQFVSEFFKHAADADARLAVKMRQLSEQKFNLPGGKKLKN